MVAANKRNPAKHRIEEHDMLNRVKANRKRMNAGGAELFQKLLEIGEKYKSKINMSEQYFRGVLAVYWGSALTMV